MKNRSYILSELEYDFVSIEKLDMNEDFEIYFKNEKIGLLQMSWNKISFIRQIRIDKKYQRKGHAKQIIEILQNNYSIVSFCISIHSESAILFWKDYLKTHNYKHIRGEIYHLQKN